MFLKKRKNKDKNKDKIYVSENPSIKRSEVTDDPSLVHMMPDVSYEKKDTPHT